MKKEIVGRSSDARNRMTERNSKTSSTRTPGGSGRATLYLQSRFRSQRASGDRMHLARTNPDEAGRNRTFASSSERLSPARRLRCELRMTIRTLTIATILFALPANAFAQVEDEPFDSFRLAGSV